MCVFRLIEAGSVSIVAVVHVDGIFAVGITERCGRFCEELNYLSPINNLASNDEMMVITVPGTRSRVF